MELNKYPPPPAGVNEVGIDDDNNVLINGNPMLLFGSFLLTHDDQNYGELAALGLNAVRSTDEELPQYEDLWFFTGAHVYAGDPSGLRNKVRAYREDPRTLVWYIADEPNEGNPLSSENGISVQLDGVNDQSTGVPVLERILDPVEPKGLKVQTK